MSGPDVAPAPPLTFVIFGATGDLTRRLLIPTMINMTRSGLIGDDFNILGVGIEPGGDEMLLQRLDSFLKPWAWSRTGRMLGNDCASVSHMFPATSPKTAFMTKFQVVWRMRRAPMRHSISRCRRSSLAKLPKNCPSTGLPMRPWELSVG